MRIDAHHHLWSYDPDDYPWVVPGSAIARDFDCSHLRRAMVPAGIDAAIAVQARQSDAETKFLLAQARADAAIIGVVGWIDLRAKDIREQIAHRPDGPLVGYRHVVQDEADPTFLLHAPFLDGVRAVAEAGLTYDLLVNAEQLATVPRFLDRVGQGRFVLDHAAKPAIMRGEWQPWADRIAEAAANPTLFCKLSGLVTEADHLRWTPADIEPYLVHLFDRFGPERLIWGSDWPVCELAAPYAATLALVDRFVARHCPEAGSAIFAANAARAYALCVGLENGA